MAEIEVNAEQERQRRRRLHIGASLTISALLLSSPISTLADDVGSSPPSRSADKAIQPERCILDTLKTAPRDAQRMIRYNCVQQYIKAVEPQAVVLPNKYFEESRIQWFPTVPAIPSPVQEHVIVTLKNNSGSQVIEMLIDLRDTKSHRDDGYKLYADWPVDPGTIGTFWGDVMTDAHTQREVQNFWKDHSWNILTVLGVPTR